MAGGRSLRRVFQHTAQRQVGDEHRLLFHVESAEDERVHRAHGPVARPVSHDARSRAGAVRRLAVRLPFEPVADAKAFEHLAHEPLHVEEVQARRLRLVQ